MNKKILVFTGLIACGKGTAAKYLVEKHGAKSFRFSTIMRNVLDRLYLEHSRDNMTNVSGCLRETFGQDLFAKVMAIDVKNSAADVVVVDGARRLPDIEHLAKLDGFKLIAVEAEARTRYKRLTERGENSDDKIKTWEQFLADHELETERSIPELMARATVRVNNNGSAEDLYKQLDKLIK